jgi:hypothetical protein
VISRSELVEHPGEFRASHFYLFKISIYVVTPLDPPNASVPQNNHATRRMQAPSSPTLKPELHDQRDCSPGRRQLTESPAESKDTSPRIRDGTEATGNHSACLHLKLWLFKPRQAHFGLGSDGLVRIFSIRTLSIDWSTTRLGKVVQLGVPRMHPDLRSWQWKKFRTL